MASPYMSRKAMEAVIDAGGSVSHQGRIYARKEDLPTAAQLAQGDPVQEAEATSDLQRQIADLQSQLATLQASQAAGPVVPAGTGSTEPSEPQGTTDGAGNYVPPVGTDVTEPGTETAPPTSTSTSGGSKK